jgi:glutathione synthase/RimK-type ligase-like ATP-grasp enzyme
MTTDADPSILIVSTKVDIATDHVVLKLSSLDASFYRLNTEDFPLASSSSLRVGGDRGVAAWSWTPAARPDVNLAGVTCVWFRRHRLPRMPDELDAAHAEYCLRESEWFIRGAVYSLGLASPGVEWMSHPANVQAAESKIYQLSVARSLGFLIPDTLVSNDSEEVRKFFDEQGGEVVAKPLRLGYIDYGERQTGIFTNRVAAGDLEDGLAIRLAPVIYQRLIPKLSDIRVTVVGRQLFAVAIDSQSDPAASVDWRRTENEELPHSVHPLPPRLEELCLAYVSTLGLNYGAIDLVLTPEGEYVFLEINPNGQWVWMEERLGLPISDAIASWLVQHSRGRTT